jgi:hypothetical protein
MSPSDRPPRSAKRVELYATQIRRKPDRQTTAAGIGSKALVMACFDGNTTTAVELCPELRDERQ